MSGVCRITPITALEVVPQFRDGETPMRYFMFLLLCSMLIVTGCSNSTPTSETSQTDSKTTEDSEPNGAAESSMVIDAAEAMGKIKSYYKEGNYKAAFPLLDQLHNAKVCPPEGYAIRAQILDHSGLTTQAISSLTLALTKQRDNSEWHNMLGLLFVKTQNIPMAQQAFTKAVELDPNYSKAYNNRGLMLVAIKEYDKAIADFDASILKSPKYVDAYNNRGYAYLELGNFEKAVENFSQSIKIDPEYVKGYNNRGFALTKMGAPEQAIADFTVAIEKSPYEVKHYLHRRDAYQAIGKLEEANQDQAAAQWVQQVLVLVRQIQRNPKDPALFVQRAELFAKREKFEEANKDLEQALKLDDTMSAIYVAQASISFKQKNYQAAVEKCTKALEFGENFDANSLRGDAYMALGKLDQAITDYQSAERFDNAVAMAYWKRAETKENGGDKAGAEKDKATALQLDPEVEKRVIK
ncbi:TPR repeat-containing protein YrrB [Rubinisphaera italica]|uniref:TPR repeat-containing protein YrrB n=2 Tax=Rubinisphaera italica TaxID=2527969 RepID=A0A5C5XLU3_9PLAN|nr:TPR repeat-containing protein YrrB [Rubinisphaera italica]